MALNLVAPSPLPPPERTQSARDPYAVILASGPGDGGKRATFALAAACTAQAMDFDTIVFLVGDGAHWAYEGTADRVHAPGFPALAELIDTFVEGGGRLLLCSACDAACAYVGARRPEVRVRGLATLLAHTVAGSTVTF